MLLKTNTNHYPFGSPMPNRSFSASSYRYGFNGQEKDDEVSGNGNTNTAMYWEYDNRLGRRWNIDPEFKQFPNESPYVAFHNNPILYNDPLGDMPSNPDKAVNKFQKKVEAAMGKNKDLKLEDAIKNVNDGLSDKDKYTTYKNGNTSDGYNFHTVSVADAYKERLSNMQDKKILPDLTVTNDKVQVLEKIGQGTFDAGYQIVPVKGAISTLVEITNFSKYDGQVIVSYGLGQNYDLTAVAKDVPAGKSAQVNLPVNVNYVQIEEIIKVVSNASGGAGAGKFDVDIKSKTLNPTPKFFAEVLKTPKKPTLEKILKHFK